MFATSDNNNTTQEEPKLNAVEPLIVGLSLPQDAPNAYWLHQQSSQDNYMFVTTPLPKTLQQERPDMTMLDSHVWHTGVVGLMEESEKDTHQSNENDWTLPLEWAWHMGLPVVIVPRLPVGDPSANTSNTQTDNAMQDEDEMQDSDSENVTSQQASRTANAATNSDPDVQLLNYARKVGKAALQAKQSNGHLWIPVTLPSNTEEAQRLLQQWSTLNRFLNLPNNIGVLLDMKGVSALSSSSKSAQPHVSLAEWPKLQLAFLHHLIGQVPIRGMRFACKDFMTNKGGYPTLSKGIQIAMTWLLKRLGGRLRILVEGPPHHFTSGPSASIGGSTGCLSYYQYLQHIRERPELRQVLDIDEARLEEDHRDRLQRPLQPLRDHLDNNTYEVFEKDPIKYSKYQEAISMAMGDFALGLPSAKPRSPNSDGTMVVLVVGAGRGPLVTNCVKAFIGLGESSRPKRVVLWAVEKNPSAYIYLQALFARLRNDLSDVPVTLNLVHSDLRDLSSERDLQGQKADLIISELLGSFGDNELSPECLDALFKKTEGENGVCYGGTVSIPSRYTAYLAPLASAKLHQQVQEQALYPNDSEGSHATNGEGSGVLGIQVAMETPYVVRPSMASQMGQAMPCWTFSHPNVSHPHCETSKGDHHNNPNEMNQTVMVEFPGDGVSSSSQFSCGYCPVDEQTKKMFQSDIAAQRNNDAAPQFSWTLTGFLGTFSADLYIRPPSSSTEQAEIVSISTVPETFSTGMFSWFPLYFPLVKPIQVPGSNSVSVRAHISRHSDTKENRVWYEWSAVVQDKSTGYILDSTAIHNPRGRSFCVSSL